MAAARPLPRAARPFLPLLALAALAAARAPAGDAPPTTTLYLEGGASDADMMRRIGERADWTVIHVSADISDELLEAIAAQPKLETLSVMVNMRALPGQPPRVTSAGLAALGRCAGLKSLQASCQTAYAPDPFDDAALAAIAAGCKSLEGLRLWYDRRLFAVEGRVTAAGVAALAQLPGLAGLSLAVAPGEADGVAAAVAKARPELTDLALYGAGGLTDAGVAALAGLAKLETLRLSDAPLVTDDGLAALASLDALKTLGLAHSPLPTDRTLDLAADHWPALTFLELASATALTDAARDRLVDARPEIALSLTDRYRLAVLPMIATYPRDQVLFIPTDADAKAFAGLAGDRTDWRAVDSLAQPSADWFPAMARFNELEHIAFDRNFVGGASDTPSVPLDALALLERCANVRRAVFRVRFTAPGDGADATESLARLARGWPKIERFDWQPSNRNNRVDAPAPLDMARLLAAFAHCPELTLLNVQQPDSPHRAPGEAADALDDAVAALAAGCPNLRELTGPGLPVLEKGLAALSKMERLVAADLRLPTEDALSDGAFKVLSAGEGGFPELRRLSIQLNATRLDERGLRVLASWKRLHSLGITYDPVAPSNPATLPARPVRAGVGDDRARVASLPIPMRLPRISELGALAGLERLGSLGIVLQADAADTALAAPLPRFPALRALVVNPPGLTVEGAAQLIAALSDTPLRSIALNGPELFGDDTMRALAAAWPTLESVTMPPQNAVGDAGLAAAAEGLPKLSRLSLGRTAAPTPDAIARFRAERPTVSLYHDRPAVQEAQRETLLNLPPNCTDEQFRQALAGRTDWTRLYAPSGLTDAWIDTLAALPELASAQIYNNWNTPARYTAAGLAKLIAAPKMREFVVGGTPLPLTDELLAALADAQPALEQLRLTAQNDEFSRITDAGLAALAAKCPNLASLTVSVAPAVTDAGLKSIAEGCPKLALLNLYGSLPFTAGGLAALSACPELTNFSLTVRERDGDAAVAALAKSAPGLANLTLRSASPDGMTSVDLAPLADLKQLQTLRLPGINDKGFAALATLTGLHTLFVHSQHLSDADLAAVANMKELTSLDLFSPLITDAGAAHLSGLTQLRDLTLYHAAFTDAGFAQLAGLTNLRSIRFDSTPALSDATLKMMAEHWKKLWRVDLMRAAAPTDEGLLALADLPDLRYVDLRGATAVTADGIKKFKEKKPNVKLMNATDNPIPVDQNRVDRRANPLALTIPNGTDDEQFAKLMAGRTDWVDIECRGDITDDRLAALAACENATRVYLEGNLRDATPRGLGRLGALKKMQSLYISYYQGDIDDELVIALASDKPDLRSFMLWYGGQNSTLSDRGMAAFANSPNLESIQIGSTPNVGDDTLVMLGRHCPKLKSLKLSNARHFTARGFAALAACPELADIWVDLPSVDAGDALAALVQATPNLQSNLIENLDGLTDDGFAAIAGWTKLRTLWLRGNLPHLTDAGLASLAGLDQLVDIELGRAPNLTDAGLEMLAKLPRLSNVEISQIPNATDAGLAALARAHTLSSIQLNGAPLITDVGLAHLAGQARLTQIAFNGASRITDAGLAHLAQLPNLNYVNFNAATRVTDAGIRALFPEGAGRTMRSLQLGAARGVTDAGLAVLAELPRIQNVGLGAAVAITAEGERKFKEKRPGSYLTTARSLAAQRGGQPVEQNPRVLVLPRDCDDDQFDQLLAARDDWTGVRSQTAALTDAWMEKLTAFPDIDTFNNYSSNPAGLTVKGMALIGRWKKLKTLSLCSANSLDDESLAAILDGCEALEDFTTCDSDPAGITADGVAAFARAKNLRKLTFRAAQPDAGDALLAALAACPRLAEFGMVDPLAFTNDGLAAFGAAPALRVVRLRPMPGADLSEGFAEFATNAKALANVSFLQYPVRDADLAAIARSATLTNLTAQDAQAVTDAGLSALAAAPKLSVLQLYQSGQVTGAGLAALAKNPALTSISLPGAVDVDGESLEAFVGHPALFNLSLPAATGVDDLGLAYLARAPKLTRLYLNNAQRVGDDGLLALAEKGNLQMLYLNAARDVTDVGVRALANGNRTLHMLELRDAVNLTDASLEALALCPNLAQLNVQNATGFTADGIAKFRRARNNVRLQTRPVQRNAPPGPPRPVAPPPAQGGDIF